MKTLVVLMVAALVPVVCTKQRCDLRDRLRAAVAPKKVQERRLARVICEVEKFVKQSVMRPASALTSPAGTSGSQDDHVERRGHGPMDAYLGHCVAATKDTDVTIKTSCFRNIVYLKVGEECKKMDPNYFFQSCNHSKHSKRSVYNEVYEDSDTEEQSEEPFESEEESEEPSESEEQSEEPSKSEEDSDEPSESEEESDEPSESEEQSEELYGLQEQSDLEEPDEKFEDLSESDEQFYEPFKSEERFKKQPRFKPAHVKSHH